jgi:hypothetical protein
LGAARIEIREKYGITDVRYLEMLLYLYPKSPFTWKQYRDMPKRFTYRRTKKLIEEGLVVLINDSDKSVRRLYNLMAKAKRIVEHFYGLLSGKFLMT